MAEQEIHRLGAQTRSLPPQLESLLSYWLQKCGARRMPGRDELPVQELKPWLGYLALIEIVGENDFHIRLAGTNLIRRFGREATGVAVSDLAFDIAKQLTAILKATAKAMAPVVAISPVALGRITNTYCEVGLPLSGPGGRLVSVLLGCYPVRES
ncbi:MAG TPA: PAS domain-containing protein [Rhizomicrobium sp.]